MRRAFGIGRIVVVGMALAVVFSGSSARAETIVTGALAEPEGVVVNGAVTVTDSNGKTSTTSRQATVAAVQASLTYPTAGQTNVSTLTPFSWTDIPAGQGYQLYIGTQHHGDGSLFKSGLLSATTSSDKVPALPTGVTLWARLYTEVAGNWDSYQDIPFTVTANRVAFTYPRAGQQNTNTTTPFSWSPATGAQAYELTVGTKPGVADLVNSGILASNITSYRVPTLPAGTTLYAKIVSKIAGSWTDYQAIAFAVEPNGVAPPVTNLHSTACGPLCLQWDWTGHAGDTDYLVTTTDETVGHVLSSLTGVDPGTHAEDANNGEVCGHTYQIAVVTVITGDTNSSPVTANITLPACS
jgi:hypothetical protein